MAALVVPAGNLQYQRLRLPLAIDFEQAEFGEIDGVVGERGGAGLVADPVDQVIRAGGEDGSGR